METEMLTIQALAEKSDEIFSVEIKVPEPPASMKRMLDALDDGSLGRQRASCIYDIRLWQAENLGFKRMTNKEAVTLLMGAEPTDTAEGERQNCGWWYNHHIDKIHLPGQGNWGSKRDEYFRMERKGLWYMPPFAKYEAWRCIAGSLEFLKRQMPYGILLKLAEAKRSKLFNSFYAVAPAEAWASTTPVDPIILGSIWLLPPNDKGEYPGSDTETRFFLAQWK